MVEGYDELLCGVQKNTVVGIIDGHHAGNSLRNDCFST